MTVWLRRLRYFLRRGQFHADLVDELALHEELTRRTLVDRGHDPARAAAEARRVLGGTVLARERAHEVWVWPWLQDLGADLRFAWRLVITDRAFTAAIVVVLALGIGVAHLQFALIRAICIRGLPIERVERVLVLGARDAGQRDIALSYEEFEHLQPRTTGISALAAFSSGPGVVGDAGRAAERVQITYVSAPVFGILRETPLLGRTFVEADDRPGATPVAILTAGTWRSRYQGDPAVIGRSIRVNGTSTTVVGVMREPLRFPTVTDAWLPLSSMPGIRSERRATRVLSVIARLTDEGTLAATRASLAVASADLSRALPDHQADMTLTAVPINERYNGRLTDPVWLAFGGVAIVVLLIACANAANLLLTRAARRGHEMGVRASIGASRARLVRQLLVESAVLALISGVVGLVLSAAGLAVVNAIVPDNTLAYWMRFDLDATTLLVLLAVSLGAVLVFGLAPAIHVARADTHALMKSGGRAGFRGRGGRRWMTAFLTMECGLTMVLLATLALGVRTAADAGRRFIAIDPTDVLTTWITLPADRYRSADARRAFYEELEARTAALPGISAAGMATVLPLGGAAPRRLRLYGDASASSDTPPTVWTVTVTPRYFDALGVPLVRGRDFQPRDGQPGAEATIVNQRFVDLFLGGSDPLGRHLQLVDPTGAAPPMPSMTIVGVAPVIRQRTMSVDADPLVYVPMAAAPPVSAVLLLRAPSAGTALVAPLREVVRAMDTELPLYRTLSMREALDVSQWNARVSEVLLYGIAVVAVCLAALGFYAILSYATLLRGRELGIRMALGAGSARMIGLVARDAATYLALGSLAGVACVYGFNRLTVNGGTVRGEPQVTDPWTLVAAAGLLTAVAMVASAAPAWRATRVDPCQILRDS